MWVGFALIRPRSPFSTTVDPDLESSSSISDRIPLTTEDTSTSETSMGTCPASASSNRRLTCSSAFFTVAFAFSTVSLASSSNCSTESSLEMRSRYSRASHAGERSPQLVGDRPRVGTELLVQPGQLLLGHRALGYLHAESIVELLQLGSPLSDQFLEVLPVFAELRLGRLSLGYIAVAGARAQRRAVFLMDRLTNVAYPALRTVAVEDAKLKKQRLLTREFLLEMRDKRVTVVGVSDANKQVRVGHQLFGAVTRYPFARRRDVDVLAIGPTPGLPVVREIRQGAEADLAVFQFLLGPLAVGYVQHARVRACEVSLLIKDRRGGEVGQQPGAVLPYELEVVLRGDPLSTFLQSALHILFAFVIGKLEDADSYHLLRPVAEHLRHAVAHKRGHGVRVEDPEPFVEALDSLPVELLALADGDQRVSEVGHVLQRQQNRFDLTILVEDRGGALRDIDPLAQAGHGRQPDARRGFPRGHRDDKRCLFQGQGVSVPVGGLPLGRAVRPGLFLFA